MPLPKPNLDDRTFQQLVDEAKRMIPRYCPEWTDHNVSDPGVTLIELFAWMVEALLYQLNRVPEKTYITLLDLLGVTLSPQDPARVELTFRLSAPVQGDTLTIPIRTTVANQVNGAEPEVNFQTDADLALYPAQLLACLVAPDGLTYQRLSLPFASATNLTRGYRVFGEPQEGDSFYLIYDASNNADLSSHVLTLNISCVQAEGSGVDPNDSPLTWEAYCKNDRWVSLEIERDLTLALNKSGDIDLYLPPDLKKYTIQDEQGTRWSGYCVRCRYNPSPVPGRFRYNESPAIIDIVSSTTGGLVPASHVATIEHEILGYSNGRPGQSFQVAHHPILRSASADEVVEVSDQPNQWEPWTVQPHFGSSKPTDPHVVIDYYSGEVRFGPAIRSRDGTIAQRGRVPPRGSAIRFRQYRTGGGAIGNVGAGKLRVLKQAVAYVDRVTNRKPAANGCDAETIEQAMQRVPEQIFTHTRAVTVADFESLALEAERDLVARARCVAQAPEALAGEGLVVYVYILPAVLSPERRLDIRTDLTADDDLCEQVRQFLDERRLLGTQVQVYPPAFVRLDLSAQLELKPGTSWLAVRGEALTQLNRFVNPYIGGHDQAGWPFGRAPYRWELEQVLTNVPGVMRLRPDSLRLWLDGRELNDKDAVELAAHVLVVAGDFNLQV